MFSIMTLIVDLTGEKGIPSFQMMVIRCIIQTFYSGFMAYWAGVNMFGEPGERTLPLLRGVFGPLATGMFVVLVLCVYYVRVINDM